jgi:alpha-1,2-mannosyltransferase
MFMRATVEGRQTEVEAKGLRAAVAAGVAAFALIGIFAIARGVLGSDIAAGAIALFGAAAVAALLWSWPVVTYDRAAVSRPLQVLSALATVAAIGQLARLAVFMINPEMVSYSLFPASTWEKRHSCLTAYFVAGRAVSTTPDVWDDALFSLPSDPTAVRKARSLGTFNVDAYEYPPPFLLLPRAIGTVVPEFLPLRSAWFGISVAGLLIAMLATARLLGPAAGTRALLLAPLVWTGVPVIDTLQKGNVQLLVIAASMLAMILFARGKSAPGGAFLGYAAVSKIYPGMLVLYLLARRQWRAVAWTSAFALVAVLLSVADTGVAPFVAFLHHLPGILGGEAFPAFRNPLAMGINMSVPGLVFKAKLFGLPGMGFAASKILGWIYTLVVVAAIVLAARRRIRDDEAPAVWLAILILSTLRSPFLPQGYGSFPALWLMTLVAAQRRPTLKTVLVVALGWVCFNIYVPMDRGLAPATLALIGVIPQMTLVLVTVLALRGPRTAAAGIASPAIAAA